MSKIKKENKREDENEEKVLTPQEQALIHFKNGLKDGNYDHYNFEEDNYYKVPCSSLIVNSVMAGGLSTGAHRYLGCSSGGKTSCALDFMFNFFKRGTGHRGIYVKSEGRLSPEVKERSGIIFTTDPLEWNDNTCLIIESNIYEFVFGFIGDLLRNNPTKTKYFIIIDSMDTMGKREDLKKPMEDCAQVAGGALLTSVFLKKTSVALAKRGSIAIFISQVRDTIKIDPRQKTDTNKQGKSSGGHALEHAGDWVLDFGARYQDDYITENPDDKKSKRLGHYCKITIVKSNNEKYGEEIHYPIKYGRTGGTSVWVERELSSVALMWELVKKEKNSYYFQEPLLTELKEKGFDVPEKFVGLKKFEQFFEDNKNISDFLFERFQKLLH